MTENGPTPEKDIDNFMKTISTEEPHPELDLPPRVEKNPQKIKEIPYQTPLEKGDSLFHKKANKLINGK